jgi:hypothetical protein
MGSLLDVLIKEIGAWPENQDYFTCDPSGEIRASLDTEYDFYPKEPVNGSDRTEEYAGIGDDFPRVTKEMWQAERDRQKGGEWKRHRAGRNQPVAGDVLVEVKLRDGDIQQAKASAFLWNHSDCDVYANIMQYRIISQPQAEEVEVKKFCTGEKCSATAENIAHSQQCQLEHEMAYTGFKIEQIDGPIKWRDTVNELDAYIEEFTRERESLINRLALEGFSLLPAMTAVMGVADIDMNDWRNWKVGDTIRLIGHDWCDLSFNADYDIVKTGPDSFTIVDDEYDHRKMVADNDTIFEDGQIPDFEFVSRP